MNDLFVLVLGTLVTALTVCAVIFFAYIFQRKLYRKEREYQNIEKLLRKEELRSVYAFVEGREQERKRISEDLHDNLGSLLATLRLYADQLGDTCEPERVNYLSEKINIVLAQALAETRRLSHELSSANVNSQGLLPSLLNLCDLIRSSGKLQVVHQIEISQPVDSQVALHIYRVIQEMFSNTLKHASASRVRLEIVQFPAEYISLIFEDDGKGFDREKVQQGLGLKNIRSRVNLLAGDLAIDSKEGIGTSFNIEIPLSISYESD